MKDTKFWSEDPVSLAYYHIEEHLITRYRSSTKIIFYFWNYLGQPSLIKFQAKLDRFFKDRDRRIIRPSKKDRARLP